MLYGAKDDYCVQAQNWQAVPSVDDTKSILDNRGKDTSDEAVTEYREGIKYSCADSYQMGTIQDENIFVSTTDAQHEQILRGEKPNANGGISGYFTDQATIEHCTNEDILNNGQLNRETQMAPFQAGPESDPGYKPHVDCFTINHDKLEQEYGTRDFNAAVAKCEANNQFGEGGGNQGFNPHIAEMMNNGCLEHDRTNSFSDSSISKLDSSLQNDKPMINSTVSQDTYDNMMEDAEKRAIDCVENNTEHPSQSVIDKTGYSHNPNPVQGITGNAIPVQDAQRADENGQTSQNNQSQQNQSNQRQKIPDDNQKMHGNSTSQVEKTSGLHTSATAEDKVTSGTGTKNTSEERATTSVSSSQNNEQSQNISSGMPNTSAEQTNTKSQSSSSGMPNTTAEQTNAKSQGSSSEMPNTAAEQTNAKSQSSSSGMPNASAEQTNAKSQGNSSGMPNASAEQTNAKNQGSSSGMPNTAAEQTNAKSQSASSGMPNTASGQSAKAPTFSSGQSQSVGHGM